MCARVIRHSSCVKFYIGANLSQYVGSHMESGTAYRGQHPRVQALVMIALHAGQVPVDIFAVIAMFVPRL